MARGKSSSTEALLVRRRSNRRSSRYPEVSEWKSQEAIDAAHKNPNVLAMWEKFFAICDCVPFRTLAEAEEMFPNFEPL